ncbi:MAG: sigma-54 dependent transcriptional regulator [Gammaproteobacteria bacterium]|nr:sigma-54 dependent transcriptional regulator [Gammaproteobacteria bacterium]
MSIEQAVDYWQHQLLGRSPEFEAVANAAKLISKLDVPVLLLGENGTGKELFARAIHSTSPRCSQNFVAINCAAIPELLFESELFGFKKGSFTSADQNYAGKIRAANNGTLFFDEIAELSLASQAKLLRFLETSECQSLGQQTLEVVNVRVIAATNQDLRQSIAEGRFRKDLYYRLNVVPVEIPPLRKRVSDIPLLINYFTRQSAAKHSVVAPVFDKKAIKQLTQYAWPGNVRELRNFCERMVIFHAGSNITADNLPREYSNASAVIAFTGFHSLLNESMSLNQFEKSIISSALAESNGNQTRAARILGITRDTLLYRIKKYNITLTQ